MIVYEEWKTKIKKRDKGKISVFWTLILAKDQM